MECFVESDRTTSLPNREIALTDMTGFNIAPASQNPTERAGFRSLLALLIVLLSDTPW